MNRLLGMSLIALTKNVQFFFYVVSKQNCFLCLAYLWNPWFSWYNLIFHHLYVNNKKKPHLKAALNWLIWKRSNWISGKLFGAKEKKISFFSWKDKNLQRSWFCNYLENEKIRLTGCRLVVLCSQTWWKIWKFEHYLLKKKCFQMHLIGACYMENNSI